MSSRRTPSPGGIESFLLAWSSRKLRRGEFSDTLRISVTAGHSVRFHLDSGDGGNWTPGAALLDTRKLLRASEHRLCVAQLLVG